MSGVAASVAASSHVTEVVVLQLVSLLRLRPKEALKKRVAVMIVERFMTGLRAVPGASTGCC